MTGRGVKEKKKRKRKKKAAGVLPASLPPGIFTLLVYGAGGAFWSCHNPHLKSKQTPPPCKACLSSPVRLSALTSPISAARCQICFSRRSSDADSVSAIRKKVSRKKKKKTAFRSSFLNTKPRSRTSCITRRDANSPAYSAGC